MSGQGKQERMCYSALVRQNLKYLQETFGATVVRDTFVAYESLSIQDPKKYRPLSADRGRIFPNGFTTVVAGNGPERLIMPMRYQAWPSGHAEDPQRLSLYNARRDNLHSPFWRDLFLKHHGFVVVEKFFEWVQVRDLLRAEQVNIETIKDEFARQSEERRNRILAAGKRYSQTPTEKLDPLQRKVIIEFTPESDEPMLVPVIFAEREMPDGQIFRSFAVVTDDPPPEVLAAGHDRCPICLSSEQLADFLNCRGSSPGAMLQLLQQGQRPLFKHALAS